MVEERLKGWAAARGYGLAIAGTGVVDEVLRKLDERRAGGMFDPGFYRESLSWVKALDQLGVSRSNRVVVVAVPSPIHVLPVKAGGRVVETIIPPTYIHYKGTFEDVLADMKANALSEGDEPSILKVPLKSLAVHVGLAVYGRNNITYVPGLGSGHQLCAYAVGGAGARPGETADAAGGEGVLERCANCRACINACPTGAIREDRFLISAERCFTLHSESRRPFPAFAKFPKSVGLIGCMDCQLVCPENKGRLKTAPSGVEISADETEAVLEAGRRLEAGEVAGLEGNAAWRSAWAKFDRLGMSEDLDVMGRNLGLFLKRG